MNYTIDRPEVMIIDNPEVMPLLKNQITLDYLKPFFEKPCSLREASKRFKVPMSSYHYWIAKFVKLGLLKIAYKKRRSGSSIKHYITTAEKIIIRLEKNPEELSEFFMFTAGSNRVYELFSQNITDHVFEIERELGLLLITDKRGEFYAKIIEYDDVDAFDTVQDVMLSTGSPAVFAARREMQLRFEDAKEFQKKLLDLVNEYEDKILKGQKKYMVRIVLVPDKYI